MPKRKEVGIWYHRNDAESAEEAVRRGLREPELPSQVETSALLPRLFNRAKTARIIEDILLT